MLIKALVKRPKSKLALVSLSASTRLRKNNLLLLVELHDLLDRRRRRAVDQIVVVLDGGPRRRQGDGAEERSFPRNRATRRAGLVDVAPALLPPPVSINS